MIAGVASILDFLSAPPGWLAPPFAHLLELLGEISQEVAASRRASSEHNRLVHLNRAQVLLNQAAEAAGEEPGRRIRKIMKSVVTYWKIIISNQADPRARKKLRPIVENWTAIVSGEIQELTVKPKQLEDIPNPYVPGRPLQLGNQQLFVGREDLFQNILSH